MDNMCLICLKRLLPHAKKLYCRICRKGCHLNCISINEREIHNLISENNWFCMVCMSYELPFFNIENDDEFLVAISEKDYFERHWDNVYEKIFPPR